ncbi:hypothetical protein D920_01572 [Enterococcus faecalis 13-SD-W-01]|nr:hypothetical protein D920_01572 [Enterococcus faecalis 13-SD-W-01]
MVFLSSKKSKETKRQGTWTIYKWFKESLSFLLFQWNFCLI